MDFANILTLFVNSSGYALWGFVIFAVIDVVFGVVNPIRSGVFSFNYLPNFLNSSLGVRYGVIVLSAILANTQSATSMKDDALGLVTAGSGAMILSLLRDIIVKINDIRTFKVSTKPVVPAASSTETTKSGG